MSFVIATPEFVTAAATDLANIGSTIRAADAAAASPTTGVLAAGADEVSAAVAALFGAHGQAYQAMSAQAAAFHNQFVQLLNSGAGEYAAAEAANASPLRSVQQDVLGQINVPSLVLTGRPLIGNGANGATPAANAPAANPAINLGIGNKDGTLNFGNGNTGSYNIGNGNTGSSNFGGGNLGTNNFGNGNLGNGNLGSGNSATETSASETAARSPPDPGNNVGMGNTGNNNFGFGNAGDRNKGGGNAGNANRWWERRQ